MDTGKLYRTILFFILFLTVIGCQKEIDDYYYSDTGEYVDLSLMEVLSQNENYSSYLSILNDYNIDTIFQKGRTVTLFIPTNETVELIDELYLDTIDWIKYHISESFINIAQIQESKKIQTSGNKFAILRKFGKGLYFDDAEITLSGPLCKDGKFYEISGFVQPLPNLYEFIGLTNPFFKSYIDSRDSTYLDLGLSRPVGYDSRGNTIYDSVLTTVNRFSIEYFPVNEESRSKKATMLLFTQEQFDQALNLIAEDLNLSVSMIPDQWKNDVLLPYLSDHGVFWNILGPSDFSSGRVRNIKGDSVTVVPSNIDFNSAIECSNGRAYNYIDFTVADSVYKGRNIIQGEHLVISKGSSLYNWNEEVVITGRAVNPVATAAPGLADNDSLLSVRFNEPNYAEDFSMTFTYKNIFPATYRLLFRAKTTPSGVYQVLVNGVVQNIDLGYGSSDRVDFYDLRNPVRSITREVFRPQSGFNSFDLLVENINSYGDVNITLKYVAPGQRSDNGFILDYVLLENFSK